jgi:hypothetical protein
MIHIYFFIQLLQGMQLIADKHIEFPEPILKDSNGKLKRTSNEMFKSATLDQMDRFCDMWARNKGPFIFLLHGMEVIPLYGCKKEDC